VGAVVRGASTRPRIGGSGKIGCRCPLAVRPWETTVVEVSVGEVSGRTVVYVRVSSVGEVHV
jgi:hypothetical protein